MLFYRETHNSCSENRINRGIFVVHAESTSTSPLWFSRYFNICTRTIIIHPMGLGFHISPAVLV